MRFGSGVRFEFRVLEQNSGLLEWDGGWLSGVWGMGGVKGLQGKRVLVAKLFAAEASAV